MKQVMAAIRSGTDPIAPLPTASFHRTLEEQISCPKCEVTYNLVVGFDWAVSRHFERESSQSIRMLRKAITMDHSSNHRVSHFETAGVIVTRHMKLEPAPPPTNRIM